MARILVVDDEDLILKALRRVLEDDGHDVVTASDGEEAWAHVAAGSVDLVITDMFMPGVDGIELLTRMLDLESGPRVIAMSGGGRVVRNTDALTDAAVMGADQILEKPFTPDAVRTAVAMALR